VALSALLVRKWYLDVQVKDSNGNNLNGATVEARNNSGALQFSATTDINGNIIRQTLIDYTNNGGVRRTQSPYNLTAFKTGHPSATLFVNMSTNQNIVMSLGGSIPLTSCGTLNQANKVYKLMNNIQTTGTCFTISANNITLDGQGYSIRSNSGGNGVYIASVNDISLYRLNISNFSYGVFLQFVNNPYLNNISVDHNAQGGIYAYSGTNNGVFENITSSFNTYGIGSDGASNNKWTNIVSYNNSYGIFCQSLTNNYTNINLSANSYGVYLSGAPCAANIFREGLISTSSLSDVYAVMSSWSNVFVNISYDINQEEVSNSFLQFTRKWYLDVQVKDQLNNPINGATINAYNKSGALQFSALTDSNGNIIRQSVIEYVNNGGTRQYYSLYNVAASKSGYSSNNTGLNISGNKDIVLTLKSNSQQPPAQPDCNVQWSGYTWQGFNGQVGMKSVQMGYTDNRFLCSGNKFYECGWELNDASLAVKSSNNQVVGNFKCDLNNKKWVSSVQQLPQWTINKFAYPSSKTEVSPDNSGYLVVEIPRPANLNGNPITQFTMTVASSNMNNKAKSFALYLGGKNVYSKTGNLVIVNLDLTSKVNEYLAQNGASSCTSTKCYIVFREKYSGGKPLNGNLVAKGYY
jgi:hypothetical protein